MSVQLIVQWEETGRPRHDLQQPSKQRLLGEVLQIYTQVLFSPRLPVRLNACILALPSPTFNLNPTTSDFLRNRQRRRTCLPSPPPTLRAPPQGNRRASRGASEISAFASYFSDRSLTSVSQPAMNHEAAFLNSWLHDPLLGHGAIFVGVFALWT